MTTLAWVCQVVLLVSGVYGLYYFFIALPVVGGLPQPKQLVHRVHRFAILVFAKDEAAVIEPLLASLKRQDYPADAFEIFVTADNCTDDTAQRALDAGATVWVRRDEQHIGKGYALTWFFDRFMRDEAHRFDACILFDADNLADPGFLGAMNRQLNAGNPIAAGYRMGKNPTSSWVAGTSSLFWLLQTRLFHLPRARRGLPVVSVGGTGWMFSLDVLDERGWHTTSVCEDIEFTLNAIAAGHHVSLAMDAVFYDEQPLTFMQSLKQRYRWSLGSVQVLGICGPKLVKAVRSDWRRTADALLFNIGIPLAGITGIAWVLGMVATGVSTGNWQAVVGTLLAGAVVGYIAVSLVAAWVMKLEKVTWPGAWQAILAFPIYVLSWSVLNVVVLFYRNPVWTTIPHVEAREIDEFSAPAVDAAKASTPMPLEEPAG